jgi:hypothetical protein
MNYAVEMGSCVVIIYSLYIYTNFHEDWFRNSKVNRGDTYTGAYKQRKVISEA